MTGLETLLNNATIAAGPFTADVSIDIDGTITVVPGVLLDGSAEQPVGHMRAREPARELRVRSSDLAGLGLRQTTTLAIDNVGYRVVAIESDTTGQTKLKLRLAGAGDINLYGDSSVDANAVYTLTLVGSSLVQQYTVNWGDGNSAVFLGDGVLQHSYLEGADPVTITVDALGTDGNTYERAAALTLSVPATATPSLARDYTAANIGEDVQFYRESPAAVENYDGQLEEIPDHCYPFSGFLVCTTFMRDLNTKTRTITQDGTSGWTEDSSVEMVEDTERGAWLYTISATSARRLKTDQTTGGFNYIDREFLVVFDIEAVVDTTIFVAIRDASTEQTTLGSGELTITQAAGRGTYAVQISTVGATWQGNVLMLLFDNSGGIGGRFYLYQVDVQDVTNRNNKTVPRPLTDFGEGSTYNSGVDGVQFITDDYSGSEVDGTGLVTFAPGNALTGFLDWQPPVVNLAIGTHDWSGPQTVTLPEAGQYTISLRGSTTLTVAADGAVGTGWGDATEASSLTIDVTTAGDITLTKGTGDFDRSIFRDLLQVERGPIATQMHPPGENPGRTRVSMALGYNDTGLADQAGLIVTKYRLINDPNLIGAGSGILTYDPNDNASVYTPDEASDLYSSDLAPFAAGDTVVSVVAYNDFWGQMRAGYSINGDAFVEDDDVQEYEDDYETVGLNDFFVRPDFPIQIEKLYVYSTNPGLKWAGEQEW